MRACSAETLETCVFSCWSRLCSVALAWSTSAVWLRNCDACDRCGATARNQPATATTRTATIPIVVHCRIRVMSAHSWLSAALGQRVRCEIHRRRKVRNLYRPDVRFLGVGEPRGCEALFLRRRVEPGRNAVVHEL